MAKKNAQTTQEHFTVIAPVVECSDSQKINKLMHSLGTVRALTYNKYGSLQGWNRSYQESLDKEIRKLCPLEQLGLDKLKKFHEWTVNDVLKAIKAQQAAARHFICRDIWQKYPLQPIEKERAQWLKDNPKATPEEALAKFPADEIEETRLKLFSWLNTAPTSDKWLHRRFRHWYRRGHTFVRNQIVLQQQAYKCKRLTRRLVEISIKSVGVSFKVKCRNIISGQIRIILKEEKCLKIHYSKVREVPKKVAKPKKYLGIDKGYTEAFYTSDKQTIGAGLGKLLTKKTEQINRTNKNRNRLKAHKEQLSRKGFTEKERKIKKHNLGDKVKSRKLQRDRATITSFIRSDLRKAITEPTAIYCEDLSRPIRGKKHAKKINRKLNQWMKGELQASLERLAQETGSTIHLVNPAYTSQIDSVAYMLLGRRDGDRFYRYNGGVFQADYNAAETIRVRGMFDSVVTLYMTADQVRQHMLTRTVRVLRSKGFTVQDALNKGWLQSKFKAEALEIEREMHPQG